MRLNRRRVVQLGTVATAGSLLPRVTLGAADQNAGFEQDLTETLTRLRSLLSDFGLTEAEPLSIASGIDDYNGGLRHDFDQSVLPPGAFVIQPLARVADIDEKSRADVLPLFHEVGCHPADADGPSTIRMMVRLLVDGFGLDPARLAFVSVPQADDMRLVLDDLDLSFTDKVHLRDEAEALAARDASGFFFPDPFGDDYLVTMGVYYRIGDIAEPAPAAYPPSENWTEIGEIIISGEAAPLGISIGAERLTFALTGNYPTWDQQLSALFALVEKESTEPPGISEFR